MPLTSRRKGVIGFAIQTGLGSANYVTDSNTHKYVTNYVSGGIAPVRDRTDLALTSSTQGRRGQYVQRARGEGTVTIQANPNLLGMLLYQVCGAQSTATRTHTFVVSDQLPPRAASPNNTGPLTVWSQVVDDWWKFGDCYISRMTIRGVSGDNILVELGLMSYGAQRLGTAPASDPSATGVSPLPLDTEPRFKYIGSTVKLGATADVPLTITNAESCEFSIDRAMELRYGSNLNPSGNIPVRNVDFSAMFTYDDTASGSNNPGWQYLAASQLGLTGAATGMTGAGFLNSASSMTGATTQNLWRGSFDVTYGLHDPSPATGNVLSLEIASTSFGSSRGNWEYAVERPEADPGGGALEMTAAGPVLPYLPGATEALKSEVTITLKNDVSGDYTATNP